MSSQSQIFEFLFEFPKKIYSLGMPSGAISNPSAGRIWPAGRQLNIPGVDAAAPPHIIQRLVSRPSVVTLACYMFYLDFSIDILNDKMIQLE